MHLSTQEFRLRWSRLTWLVTGAVIILVAVVAIVILRAAAHVGSRGNLVRGLLILEAAVPVAILGIVALFAPLGYEVNPDAVVIRRLVRNVVISRKTIREVRRVKSAEIGFAVRLFASGGFLGWFGLFFSHSLRRFWAYAGNRDDLVLVTQADGTRIVISPHPPDAFLETVWATDGGRRLW
jgi:hypothetical protein